MQLLSLALSLLVCACFVFQAHAVGWCGLCNNVDLICGSGLRCQRVGLGTVSRCKCLKMTGTAIPDNFYADNNKECWNELEGAAGKAAIQISGDRCSPNEIKTQNLNGDGYDFEKAYKQILDTNYLRTKNDFYYNKLKFSEGAKKWNDVAH